VPLWVDTVKLEGIRRAGAEAVLAGATFDESEALARRAAADQGRTYVSAYDDPWVIAGQGTVGEEVLDELRQPPGALLVPLSGGGLVGGIAKALTARLGSARPRFVAVSARNAAVMQESVEAGRPIELPEQETLANALAGGIGLDNRYSFALVRDHVDEYLAVDEAAIAGAMRYSVGQLRLVVEGGGAVALAALLSDLWAPPAGLQGPVVVVLSGGNVSSETLIRVLRHA
jgi:threonine dehydratase